MESSFEIKNEIKDCIYFIREEKVMLDVDLAQLYGIETKKLKELVRRNIQRFPPDFMFELTIKELFDIRSQNAVSKTQENNGSIRYFPMVFTERGIAMLSCVLNSEQAIMVNVQMVRLLGQMRKLILQNNEIRLKLEDFEKRVGMSDDKILCFDNQVQAIFRALKQLFDPAKHIGKSIELK
ncbi:MAG TPA: ORF6N domain-containing protein [Flavobacteriales bacterium]|nr:ORF6N domain-containing protein [Flavobacteriales bacterium]